MSSFKNSEIFLFLSKLNKRFYNYIQVQMNKCETIKTSFKDQKQRLLKEITEISAVHFFILTTECIVRISISKAGSRGIKSLKSSINDTNILC